MTGRGPALTAVASDRGTLRAGLRRLVETAGDGYGIIARGPVPL